MKIAHFALWTQQLDVQARFWVDFFAASINEKYLSQTNPGFASYFVTIDDETTGSVCCVSGSVSGVCGLRGP